MHFAPPQFTLENRAICWYSSYQKGHRGEVLEKDRKPTCGNLLQKYSNQGTGLESARTATNGLVSSRIEWNPNWASLSRSLYVRLRGRILCPEIDLAGEADDSSIVVNISFGRAYSPSQGWSRELLLDLWPSTHGTAGRGGPHVLFTWIAWGPGWQALSLYLAVPHLISNRNL